MRGRGINLSIAEIPGEIEVGLCLNLSLPKLPIAALFQALFHKTERFQSIEDFLVFPFSQRSPTLKSNCI
jgi:hypothetical protein